MNTSRKLFGIFALMSAALVMTPSANAGTYSFDFIANDSSHGASGMLTTSDVLNAVGGYDIYAITGSVTGAGGGAITSLVSNPSQPYASIAFGFQYDNVAFASSPAGTPSFDNNGVLFTAGGYLWNLYSNSTIDFELYSYGVAAAHGSTIMAAVPEPETYAMLLAGLGLMGFVARRRHAAAA